MLSLLLDKLDLSASAIVCSVIFCSFPLLPPIHFEVYPARMVCLESRKGEVLDS